MAGAQRTIRAAYTFPPEVLVSAECRDLISRIFQADPDKRATVEDIRRHPWFLKDLPPELAVRSSGFLGGLLLGMYASALASQRACRQTWRCKPGFLPCCGFSPRDLRLLRRMAAVLLVPYDH